MGRVAQLEPRVDEGANLARRLRHVFIDKGFEFGQLIGQKRACAPLIGQRLDAAAPCRRVKRAMLAHGALINEKSLADPRRRPAVVQKKQHIHPPMHRAVQLTTHHIPLRR